MTYQYFSCILFHHMGYFYSGSIGRDYSVGKDYNLQIQEAGITGVVMEAGHYESLLSFLQAPCLEP